MASHCRIPHPCCPSEQGWAQSSTFLCFLINSPSIYIFSNVVTSTVISRLSSFHQPPFSAPWFSLLPTAAGSTFFFSPFQAEHFPQVPPLLLLHQSPHELIHSSTFMTLPCMSLHFGFQPFPSPILVKQFDNPSGIFPYFLILHTQS